MSSAVRREGTLEAHILTGYLHLQLIGQINVASGWIKVILELHCADLPTNLAPGI